MQGYEVYKHTNRKLSKITKFTLENLETITLMIEITLKKLYDAIIDDPNVEIASCILFNTINIEKQIRK